MEANVLAEDVEVGVAAEVEVYILAPHEPQKAASGGTDRPQDGHVKGEAEAVTESYPHNLM